MDPPYLSNEIAFVGGDRSRGGEAGREEGQGEMKPGQDKKDRPSS